MVFSLWRGYPDWLRARVPDCTQVWSLLLMLMKRTEIAGRLVPPRLMHFGVGVHKDGTPTGGAEGNNAAGGIRSRGIREALGSMYFYSLAASSCC